MIAGLFQQGFGFAFLRDVAPSTLDFEPRRGRNKLILPCNPAPAMIGLGQGRIRQAVAITLRQRRRLAAVHNDRLERLSQHAGSSEAKYPAK